MRPTKKPEAPRKTERGQAEGAAQTGEKKEREEGVEGEEGNGGGFGHPRPSEEGGAEEEGAVEREQDE